MKRDYKISNVEICRRCTGEGVVLNENLDEVICSLCKGNGMVTVEKDLSISIFPKTPKPHAGSR